jgi:hypothetical protein
MEVKGKIICKKSDNKAFKLGNDWYNVNDNVVPYLEKINKGDEIVVTFEKKGTNRYVSKLVSGLEVPKEETKQSSTGFACEVCGKELKDEKFKKCYTCNKSGATKKEEVKTTEVPVIKEWKTFDNPGKTAQIQRGNAGNMAATVASSQQFNDIETATQFTLELAERFLEWLRNE